jgi:hypothetical protein
MSKTHPDILLSIGAGYSDDASVASDSSALKNSLEDGMNTEAIWSKIFGDSSRRHPARYIRLCPKFPEPLPTLDDISKLGNGYLKQVTDEFLRDDRRTKSQDSIGSKVDLVIRRLISTTFYFHPTSPPSYENGELFISGM